MRVSIGEKNVRVYKNEKKKKYVLHLKHSS